MINANVRDTLLELTGVDVWFLDSVSIESPRGTIWRIHGMCCDVCGKSWNDNIRLARHHRIPLRLCRILGLSKLQARNEQNMAVLCEKHHDIADKRLRIGVAEKLPDLYCWKVKVY
jgi:5-methylcytosine-specific restriction endonuclease McrA